MEAITNELEAKAEELIGSVQSMGGAVAAIEEGWMQAQIEDSAYREAKRQGTGDSVVVGVNRFTVEDSQQVPVLEIDPELEAGQKQRLAVWRAARDADEVSAALSQVEAIAATNANLMDPIKDALKACATVGEISDALRGVFGEHRAT